MIGTSWGRWEVLGEAERDRYDNRKWRCRCACGVVSIVYQNALRGGRSTQCRTCGRKQSNPKRAAANTTHGKRGTHEYRVWDSMHQRCLNPHNKSYPQYGARGITICEEWQGIGGFECFFAYVGVAPVGKTIDRIDNNRSYEPGNVQWSTPLEQARNTRQNREIEFDGRKMCLSAWAVEVGIMRETITRRLNRGWSVEKALTVKPSHI